MACAPPEHPRPPLTGASRAVEEADIKPMLHEVEDQHRAGGGLKLDITTLKNGDMIEGRYRFIERIGKGAFGTVLLMEDTVVDDRLILKFLNPNVSEDEEMMKRFVHELRYSRKITHHNVIRILRLPGRSRATTPSRWSISPPTRWCASRQREARRTKKRSSTHRHVHRHGRAHKGGIVHRDLKPANVLINNEDC